MLFLKMRSSVLLGVSCLLTMFMFPLLGENNSDEGSDGTVNIVDMLFPDEDIEYSLQGLELLDKSRLPKHIAIIMDGNRRWAKQNNLAAIEGHAKGANAVVRLLKFISEIDLGIEALTLYSFSTENWSRPAKEVEALMNIFSRYIHDLLPKFKQYSIRLETIGDLTKLPQSLQDQLVDAKLATASGSSFTLILALNYGGRDEIKRAVYNLSADIEQGLLTKEDISEKLIQSYLDTSFVGDPELYIRTSNEHRVSNFLLWQMAYAELYFPKMFWPDFSEQELVNALLEFQRRDRRFGGNS